MQTETLDMFGPVKQPRRTRKEPQSIHDAARLLRKAGHKVYRAGPEHHNVDNVRTTNATLLDMAKTAKKKRTGAKRDKTHAPKDLNAYFTIDPRPIPALLKHVKLRGVVWESAAGRGHMSNALEIGGYMTYPTDIKDHRIGAPGEPQIIALQDFFSFVEVPHPSIQSIVTNPPNDKNIAFAAHAIALMSMVGGQVAFYQRHDWDAAQNTASIFDLPCYAMKIVCRFRPRWFEKVKGQKDSSPFHRFSWYVWDWQHSGPPIMRFA